MHDIASSISHLKQLMGIYEIIGSELSEAEFDLLEQGMSEDEQEEIILHAQHAMPVLELIGQLDASELEGLSAQNPQLGVFIASAVISLANVVELNLANMQRSLTPARYAELVALTSPCPQLAAELGDGLANLPLLGAIIGAPPAPPAPPAKPYNPAF